MRILIHKTMEKLASLLFPDRCTGCKQPGSLFCNSCKTKSKQTRKENTSLPFLDKLYHWGLYSNKTLQTTLKHLKYRGAFGLSNPLSDMLTEIIKPHLSAYSECPIVLSIPTSPDRIASRGYNQAELLGREVARKTALLFLQNALIKTKSTATQVNLKGTKRIFNVSDSFSVAEPRDVEGKTVVLVDDISTTGATLSEAARVLKEAGAKEIVGLVVAIG